MNTENEALIVQHSIDSLEAEQVTTEIKRCCNNCYITLTICSEKKELEDLKKPVQGLGVSLFLS